MTSELLEWVMGQYSRRRSNKPLTVVGPKQSNSLKWELVKFFWLKENWIKEHCWDELYIYTPKQHAKQYICRNLTISNIDFLLLSMHSNQCWALPNEMLNKREVLRNSAIITNGSSSSYRLICASLSQNKSWLQCGLVTVCW